MSRAERSEAEAKQRAAKQRAAVERVFCGDVLLKLRQRADVDDDNNFIVSAELVEGLLSREEKSLFSGHQLRRCVNERKELTRRSENGRRNCWLWTLAPAGACARTPRAHAPRRSVQQRRGGYHAPRTCCCSGLGAPAPAARSVSAKRALHERLIRATALRRTSGVPVEQLRRLLTHATLLPPPPCAAPPVTASSSAAATGGLGALPCDATVLPVAAGAHARVLCAACERLQHSHVLPLLAGAAAAAPVAAPSGSAPPPASSAAPPAAAAAPPPPTPLLASRAASDALPSSGDVPRGALLPPSSSAAATGFWGLPCDAAADDVLERLADVLRDVDALPLEVAAAVYGRMSPTLLSQLRSAAAAAAAASSAAASSDASGPTPSAPPSAAASDDASGPPPSSPSSSPPSPSSPPQSAEAEADASPVVAAPCGPAFCWDDDTEAGQRVQQAVRGECTVLDLRCIDLNNEDADCIYERLKGSVSLKALDVRGNHFDDTALLLLSLLVPDTFTVLHFEDNPGADEFATYL
jgi:hypothetical protein